MPWWGWVIIVFVAIGLFDYLLILGSSKLKKVKE